MAGPANRGLFSRLLAPGLRKVFFDNYNLWPEEYSTIFNVESSTRAYEEELMIAGLGLFEEKGEGKSLVWDSGKEGPTQRYNHVSFSLGFRITREMHDDDLYSVMQKLAKELGQSARLTVEYKAAELLDDIFIGDKYRSADGKPICATDHQLIIGGEYANRSAVPSDLGIGSLRAASERLERTPNERGLPENRGRGKNVVITPTYQWIAKEIIGTELKPYTSDNTTNAFNEMGLNYTVNHYILNDDLWLLTADKAQHDLKFFWRTKPEFNNDDDFDTGDAKFKGFMRFSLGATDWRGVDGGSADTNVMPI